jgi:hypothetical protein
MGLITSAAEVNIFGDNMDSINKSKETIIDAG